MIVLVNFNSYLGGGETLLVRFAKFLEQSGKEFLVICSNNSYIQRALSGSGSYPIITFEESEVNYYYLSQEERRNLVNSIVEKLRQVKNCILVPFCFRDLYTMTQVSKHLPDSKTVHLILHPQDVLYVTQSVLDKGISRLFSRHFFTRRNIFKLNSRLVKDLIENNAIIPMGDLMVDYWNSSFKLPLTKSSVVPLPFTDFNNAQRPTINRNEHKILWIGRIVDFKIPALCSMLNYVNTHKECTLTIVGSGDINVIDNYIRKNKIDSSRLSFLGEVDNSLLGNIIQEHSIGYAMGTSIIEICRYGLPTIMALGSPSHKLFNKDICGGVYSNSAKGNVGSNIFVGQKEDQQPLLEDTMNYINSNYEQAAKACFDHVANNYDITTNINKYLEIIEGASRTDFNNIEIPKVPILRRWMYKLFNR